jgi:hypothetical protein
MLNTLPLSFMTIVFGEYMSSLFAPFAGSVPLSRLQVARTQAGALCDAGQHARSDLLAVVKGENVVRPPVAHERLVRARLALDSPADTEQGLKQNPCTD